MNDQQRFVIGEYVGGEFSDITDPLQAKDVGDGLFTFLLDEANDSEDLEDFHNMLCRAIGQLQQLERAALERLLTL